MSIPSTNDYPIHKCYDQNATPSIVTSADSAVTTTHSHQNPEQLTFRDMAIHELATWQLKLTQDIKFFDECIAKDPAGPGEAVNNKTFEAYLGKGEDKATLTIVNIHLNLKLGKK